jgi:hypothetical protein
MSRFLCVLLMASLALASPVGAAEPIVLGAYLSMTGGVASYGQMGWRHYHCQENAA